MNADPGPFDCAQGSLAKAIVILDADNRITFATRIAGAILERFYWDEDPSTELRDPWLSRKMNPSTGR